MKTYPALKRLFDIVFSFIGLVILLPLFIILGLVVIINDRGPALFRQRRVGRGGRFFILYKFRTMKIARGTESGIFEPGNTSRVTAAGRFMRRTKLDELPQLFNVLKGDMSFVGPRPEVERWIEYYPEKWKKILTVRPGITDRASLEFRDEESYLSESTLPEYIYLNEILPRKLDLCLSYVDSRTFLGDIKIILHTLNTIMFK